MRVRGWYIPGNISANNKEAGIPGLMGFPIDVSNAADSFTLGPSKASSPRPSPLGFLVTIALSLLIY